MPIADIPNYLDEPIDILADTVLEMSEKLAYKAHSGCYVEGLWDASLSTSVGVIREKVDWQPMQLNFHTGDLKLSYDPEVSDVPQYCKHSGLHTFHGYVSEPPIAPAFKESTPVGLAAPALRAYGTMEALLEYEGRESEVPDLKDYFCKLWGADLSVLENTQFLKPSLSSRSDTDLVKSLRSKSHRLYGYENEQNYVSVTMGNYTQGSLSEKRYVDWHRLGIILRYIGVMLLTSDELGRAKLWDSNSSLQYGIVAREFPLVVNAPHAPSFKNVPASKKIDFLNQALTVAMRYYSSHHVVSAVSHSLMLQQSKVRISPGTQLDSVSIAVLRRGLTTDNKMIPVSFKRTEHQGYDILKPDGNAGNRSKRALLNDVKIYHQISVYRAIELFTMLKLHSHWNQRTSVTLRQIFDRLTRDFEKPLEFKMESARAIIAMYGRNSGEDIWSLVQRFRRDITLAQEDFISFCVGMTDESVQLASLNMSQLWWDCICHRNSYPMLRKLYLSAWQKYVSNMNHPSVPKFPVDAPLREFSELADMTAHLWGKKRAYWVGHYKQRRDDWSRYLRTNPNAMDEIIQTKKAELIRYQWLVRWLQEYIPVVHNKLEVWPEIPNSKACALLQNTMVRYTRKRRDDALCPLPHEPYKTYARRLDDRLKPVFTFLQLVNTVHTTAKQITGDIAYMYRKLLEPSQQEQGEETIEDIWRKEMERHYYEEARWADWSKQQMEHHIVSWADHDEEEEIPDTFDHEAAREAARARAESLINMTPHPQVPLVEPEEDEDERMVELDEEDPNEFDDMDDMFAPADSLPEGLDRLAEALSATLDQSALRRKSPLTEMYEKYNRVPDVSIWASRANCDLAELRAIELSRFDEVMKIGEQLLSEEASNPAELQQTYDVL